MQHISYRKKNIFLVANIMFDLSLGRLSSLVDCAAVIDHFSNEFLGIFNKYLNWKIKEIFGQKNSSNRRNYSGERIMKLLRMTGWGVSFVPFFKNLTCILVTLLIYPIFSFSRLTPKFEHWYTKQEKWDWCGIFTTWQLSLFIIDKEKYIYPTLLGVLNGKCLKLEHGTYWSMNWPWWREYLYWNECIKEIFNWELL